MARAKRNANGFEAVLFPGGAGMDPEVSRVLPECDWDRPLAQYGHSTPYWDTLTLAGTSPSFAEWTKQSFLIDWKKYALCMAGEVEYETSLQKPLAITAGDGLLVVSLPDSLHESEKRLMEEALQRIVKQCRGRSWFEIKIDNPKTIEQYRAVIEQILGDVASVTLRDDDGEPVALLDVPRADLYRQEISFTIGSTFDLIVQQVGECERILLRRVESSLPVASEAEVPKHYFVPTMYPDQVSALEAVPNHVSPLRPQKAGTSWQQHLARRSRRHQEMIRQ